MFIDEAKVRFKAGKGGDGAIAWRREKYIPKGGPFGGNGGNGGSIILRANPNENTLSEFRHKKEIKAKNGGNGGTQELAGANAPDIIINLPVGTLVKSESGSLIQDLSEPWQEYVLCRGGRGGYGNAHFVSSTRQAPGFAEIGDIGEEVTVQLELKLVADIGIIGLPNAGKSTLIKSITNVKPKIASYPFTTIIPNLGVMDHKGRSLVIEDVPGLIEGASSGKGLGHSFLKHIERTRVLLHLIDLNGLDDIEKNYRIIRNELERFGHELATKEEIIVLSKADLFDAEMIDFIVNEFKKRISHDSPIFIISAPSFQGIEVLKDFLIDRYATKEEHRIPPEESEPMRIYDLKTVSDPNAYTIEDIGEMQFRVSGQRIEQIVRMTDMKNHEAVMRVYDVMKKVGIIKKVESIIRSKYENGMQMGYFEGSEQEYTVPKLSIGDKVFLLDKILFDS